MKFLALTDCQQIQEEFCPIFRIFLIPNKLNQSFNLDLVIIIVEHLLLLKSNKYKPKY